jgi:hypothetical protein
MYGFIIGAIYLMILACAVGAFTAHSFLFTIFLDVVSLIDDILPYSSLMIPMYRFHL